MAQSRPQVSFQLKQKQSDLNQFEAIWCVIDAIKTDNNRGNRTTACPSCQPWAWRNFPLGFQTRTENPERWPAVMLSRGENPIGRGKRRRPIGRRGTAPHYTYLFPLWLIKCCLWRKKKYTSDGNCANRLRFCCILFEMIGDN